MEREREGGRKRRRDDDAESSSSSGPHDLLCRICMQHYLRGKYIIHVKTPYHQSALALGARREQARREQQAALAASPADDAFVDLAAEDEDDGLGGHGHGDDDDANSSDAVVANVFRIDTRGDGARELGLKRPRMDQLLVEHSDGLVDSPPASGSRRAGASPMTSPAASRAGSQPPSPLLAPTPSHIPPAASQVPMAPPAAPSFTTFVGPVFGTSVTPDPVPLAVRLAHLLPRNRERPATPAAAPAFLLADERSTGFVSFARTTSSAVRAAGARWMRAEPYSDSLTTMLHQEIEDYVRYLAPCDQEERLRLHVIGCIREVVDSLWPRASLRVFGSFATKLYVTTSDVDLVVMNVSAHSMRTLAQALRAKGLVARMELIEKARVPIIKLVDSIGGFSIDISFDTAGGVSAAHFVREAVEAFPALRPLTIVLKQFLHHRRLNEVFTGGLGSFALTLMVLSFLKLHPRVQSGRINPEHNLGVLLLEFLHLYGKKFSSQDVGIDVRSRQGYFARMGTEFFESGELVVVDPHAPANNVSRGSYNYRSVSMAFEIGADMLARTIIRSNNQRTSEHVSLLQTILPDDLDLVARRQHLIERATAIGI